MYCTVLYCTGLVCTVLYYCTALFCTATRDLHFELAVYGGIRGTLVAVAGLLFYMESINHFTTL